MIDIDEPTDCVPCTNGRPCVAHASLFVELTDLPGVPAPASWGKTRPAPVFEPTLKAVLR